LSSRKGIAEKKLPKRNCVSKRNCGEGGLSDGCIPVPYRLSVPLTMESTSQSGRLILSHDSCPVNPLLQLESIWELEKRQIAADSGVFAYLW
jgi:hypothetical protein